MKQTFYKNNFMKLFAIERFYSHALNMFQTGIQFEKSTENIVIALTNNI